METVDFVFEDGNVTFSSFFSFLKSFGFFIIGGGIVIIDRQNWETGCTRSFGCWNGGLFFGIHVTEDRRVLQHNFLKEMSLDAGHKQVQNNVVVAVLNAKVNEIQGDLRVDVNSKRLHFGLSTHDGFPRILW